MPHSLCVSLCVAISEEAERSNLAKQKSRWMRVALPMGDSIKVMLRPGVDKFLRSLSRKYEVIVYTAGLQDYARHILDRLDPDNKYFKHRLYRDSCAYIEKDGLYVKNLSFLNRDMKRIVLVDNSLALILAQLEQRNSRDVILRRRRGCSAPQSRRAAQVS